MIKVSIVVPVYMVEEYIGRCFDSIAAQSYKHIECFFVDDFSQDNSITLLMGKLENYDGEISFYLERHSENLGLSAARNTGTKLSTGDYIYYLDSDDELTPNCISGLVQKADKYPGVDIVQGNTRTIPKPNNDWRDITLKKFPEYSNDPTWIKTHFFEAPLIPVNAWNKLVRKGFLLSNNIFFLPGIVHEDSLWCFYLSKKISSIAFLENDCYLHYIREDSIMTSSCKERSLKSKLIIAENIFDNIDDNLTSLQRRYFLEILSSFYWGYDKNKHEPLLFSRFRDFTKSQILDSFKGKRYFETLLYFFFYIPRNVYLDFISRRAFWCLTKYVSK